MTTNNEKFLRVLLIKRNYFNYILQIISIYIFTFHFDFNFHHPRVSDGSTPVCLLKTLMNGWFDATGSDGKTEIDQPAASTWTFHFKFLKGILRAEEIISAQFNPPKPAWLRPSASSSVISVISNWEEEKEKSSTNFPAENIFIRGENVRDGGRPRGVRPAFWFLSKFVPAHHPDTRGEILNIMNTKY